MTIEKVGKKKKISPILDQILNGGASTSLNVLGVTRAMAPETPFFDSTALNRVIVFKYPNFTDQIADTNTHDYTTGETHLSTERPVETGVYIPNDETIPNEGGFAIYLRQRGSAGLLKQYLGVSEGDTAMADDMRKLDLIDQIPSLDPFLLKTTLEQEKIYVDPAYLNMAHKEEDEIKNVISEKVQPIVGRALGTDKASIEMSQRFIAAIWDPTLPEAKIFIDAFKISENEIANIFGAWKGVSFYQQQFHRNRVVIAQVLQWLKSDLSKPIDARAVKPYLPQMDMHKNTVQKKMMNILGNINQIFKDFDGCYDTFINDGNPAPFRNFLVTSHFRYWILGYCCTALIHCQNTFTRYMDNSIKNQLTFEQTTEMLTHLDTTLSSQATTSKQLA